MLRSMIIIFSALMLVSIPLSSYAEPSQTFVIEKSAQSNDSQSIPKMTKVNNFCFSWSNNCSGSSYSAFNPWNDFGQRERELCKAQCDQDHDMGMLMCQIHSTGAKVRICRSKVMEVYGRCLRQCDRR
jgi:hypothetical protein